MDLVKRGEGGALPPVEGTPLPPLPSGASLPPALEQALPGALPSPVAPGGEASSEGEGKPRRMNDLPFLLGQEEGPEGEDAFIEDDGFSEEEEEEEDYYDDEEEEEEPHDYSGVASFRVQEEEEEEVLLPIDAILGEAIEARASDVDIVAGMPLAFRIEKEVRRQEKWGVPDATVMGRTQKNLISHVMDSHFVRDFELDVSYILKEGKYRGHRTRLNICKVDSTPALCFRIINNEIPTPESLGLDEELVSWVEMAKGLVMINGPTGSGKTTTIASLVNRATELRPHKVVTLEKPIEYVYSNSNRALVLQREIGRDAHSFSNALKSAMRQAPDIIVVGEVRDREEVDALIQAVETGHFCVSTMHTESAPGTLNRILALYQGDDLRRIRASLSDVARGFVNQVLLKRAEGGGMVAVQEVLPVDKAVQQFIFEGNAPKIREYQERQGITMEHELVRAVKAGKVRREDAERVSTHRRLFNELMDGH